MRFLKPRSDILCLRQNTQNVFARELPEIGIGPPAMNQLREQ
jgi:hypothetical protein